MARTLAGSSPIAAASSGSCTVIITIGCVQVHSSVKIGTAGAISSAKTMSHSRRRSALTSSGNRHAAKIDNRLGTCGIAHRGGIEIDRGSARNNPTRVDAGERVVVLHVEPRFHGRGDPGGCV